MHAPDFYLTSKWASAGSGGKWRPDPTECSSATLFPTYRAAFAHLRPFARILTASNELSPKPDRVSSVSIAGGEAKGGSK
jgi:hypothetical protein